ncbi:hypothetical protein AB3480_01190 [Rhizobium mongolense]
MTKDFPSRRFYGLTTQMQGSKFDCCQYC